MWEAPSTCRARMWLIEPRRFSAEYSGLIAAPGTPKAVTTPSFSRIRTAASIARIFAISNLARPCCPGPIITAATCDLNDDAFVSRDVGGTGKSAVDQVVGWDARWKLSSH